MGSALYGPAFAMWLVILMYYIELIIIAGDGCGRGSKAAPGLITVT